MAYSRDFKVASARRFPDPVGKTSPPIDHYMFLAQCNLLPDGIGDGPNARTPNLQKRTYRAVKESLLAQSSADDGMFHMYNKGIEAIASRVEKLSNDDYRVWFDDEHGVVDGGHTYRLIQENKANVSDNQFVRFNIKTNVPDSLVPSIAGALNTTVQVQEMSLTNLEGRFGWLQSKLGSLKSKVAWQENEDNQPIDARDLVSILLLTNIKIYPNLGSGFPIEAYNSKAKALAIYQEQQASFEKMEDLVKDILALHDKIASTSVALWNSASVPTQGRKLEIIDTRKRGTFEFPFGGFPDSDNRLSKSVLYPILSSFRWFIRENSLSGRLEWICDFQEVQDFWTSEGRELLEIAYSTSKDMKYNLPAVGKNKNFWTALHSKVGMRVMASGKLNP